MNDKELYSPEYFKSYSLECNPFKADNLVFEGTITPINTKQCVLEDCQEFK